MRFCLVGSYNLADGYLGAAKSLIKKGHHIDFVPAHKYKSEFPDTHTSKIIEDINYMCI